MDGPRPPNPLTRQASSTSLYECPICADLLYEPVTVACGHSACRRCVTLWFKTSGSFKCPAGCATALPPGIPAPNVLLKEKLQRSFGEQYKLRRVEVEAAEAAEPVLDSVQGVGAAGAAHPAGRRLPQADAPHRMWQAGVRLVRTLRQVDDYGHHKFCGLVAVALYVLSRILLGSSRMDYAATIAAWQPEEVQAWLTEADLEAFSPLFTETAMDGEALLDLTPSAIDAWVGEGLPKSQFAVKHFELLHPSELPASDFWEFRQAHRFTSTMLLVLFTLCPRVAFFYVYMFASDVSASLASHTPYLLSGFLAKLFLPHFVMLGIAIDMAPAYLRSVGPGVLVFMWLTKSAVDHDVLLYASVANLFLGKLGRAAFGALLGVREVVPLAIGLAMASGVFFTWYLCPWIVTDILTYGFILWCQVVWPLRPFFLRATGLAIPPGPL